MRLLDIGRREPAKVLLKYAAYNKFQRNWIWAYNGSKPQKRIIAKRYKKVWRSLTLGASLNDSTGD